MPENNDPMKAFERTQQHNGSFERTSLRGWQGWAVPLISLAYSSFWFIKPVQMHSGIVWARFLVFYVIFLLCYWRLLTAYRRERLMWMGVMFLLGYVYFPFHHAAAGEFVYPVVFCAAFLWHPRLLTALATLGVIIVSQCAGILLECHFLHIDTSYAYNVMFYIVVLGLCNFVYSRQQLMSEQLRRANDEIERLAQTAERERIARDLHDLLGHTLTTIVLKSDVANRMFELDPAMARREIAEVGTTARKALAEVREAVAGYRAEGFAAEVARARRTLASAGVQLTTGLEPIELDSARANALCLVLREAVTNVVRHAGATACYLELAREGSWVRMTVGDNGAGALGVEGNGSRGMRERLGAFGGSLRRERGADGGLSIVAELELSRAGVAAGLADTGRVPVHAEAVQV